MTEEAILDAQDDPEQGTVVAADRQLQWLQMGKAVDGSMTKNQVLKEVELDWDVEKRKLFTENKKGNKVVIPGRFAIVKLAEQEKVLGVVASHYQEFQNRQVVQFIYDLLEAAGDDAILQAGWKMRGERVIGFTLKVPGDMVVAEEDALELYLLVRSSHDGTKALNAHITCINPRCTNMVGLATHKRNVRQKWSIQHVSTLEQRVAEAKNALGLIRTYRDEYVDIANRLAKIDLELESFHDLLQHVLPNKPRTPEVISRIESLYAESPNISEKLRNTAWGGVQAITEYFDWGRTTRSAEARFMTAVDGAGATVRDRAAALLLARG